MRWLTKTAVEPEFGDTRTITVFAWWPIRCNFAYTVWLERVHAVQRYSQYATEYGTASYASHTQQKWITNYYVVRER